MTCVEFFICFILCAMFFALRIDHWFIEKRIDKIKHRIDIVDKNIDNVTKICEAFNKKS